MSQPVLKQVSILHVTVEYKNLLKWKVACQHEYLNYRHTYLDSFFMKLVNYFSCFCCISELVYFVNSANAQKVPSPPWSWVITMGQDTRYVRNYLGKKPWTSNPSRARNPYMLIHGLVTLISFKKNIVYSTGQISI